MKFLGTWLLHWDENERASVQVLGARILGNCQWLPCAFAHTAQGTLHFEQYTCWPPSSHQTGSRTLGMSDAWERAGAFRQLNRDVRDQFYPAAQFASNPGHFAFSPRHQVGKNMWRSRSGTLPGAASPAPSLTMPLSSPPTTLPRQFSRSVHYSLLGGSFHLKGSS